MNSIRHTHAATPRLLLVRALALATMALVTTATAQDALKDLPNAKDPPLLSRFAGSTLVGYAEKSFGEMAFPLTSEVRDGRYVKAQTFEGKVTEVAYLAPIGKTRLEVQRNYQEALAKAGFVKKFACDGDACGRGPRIVDPLIDDARTMRQVQRYGGYSSIAFLVVNTSDAHDIWGTIKSEGRDVAVGVLISTLEAVDSSPLNDRVGVFVQVVEPKAMESGQVTVDASAMQKGITADGKIALYGVYFDTGRADVKSESKPQLEQMAKLLDADRTLKVVIVGHTDNQGTLDANLALSQHRADAIVAALVKDEHVDPKRLVARGVANLAPVASNDTDAGRARNRRVELVKQ